MTTGLHHPINAPCWIESLQPGVEAAMAFYGPLLGWQFDDPAPDGLRCARLRGRRVAGIRQAPPILDRGAWVSYVQVADLAETVETVSSAGGSVVLGPTEDHDGRPTALLADPFGAPFGIQQTDSPYVAETVDEPGAWQMSSLHTLDLTVAEQFYATAFGWRPDSDTSADFALWHLPDSSRRALDPTLPDDVIATATPIAPAAPMPPHWSVNVRVTDVNGTAEFAEELGGQLLMPPMNTPGFRNAVIADPAGGILALSQQIA